MQRVLLKLLIATAALTVMTAASAQTQDYPNKPIRLVVPYPPGSASDGVARMLTEELHTELKAAVVIDNRPGASGLIGTEHVARSLADGYTLLVNASATHSANPWLFKQLPYDPIKDFSHISRLVVLPQLVVSSPSLAAASMQDLVKYGQANPGKLIFAYGTPTSQVASAAIANIAKFDALGVPYKGPADALLALIRGEAQFMVADLSTGLQQAKAGKLRALAITTAQRSPMIPEVPSLAELGYRGFDVVLWIGVSGPSGLPKSVVQQLSGAFTKILSKPALKDRFSALGMQAAPTTPDEFERFVQEQLAVWGARIKATGLQPQ